jgi:hypothetical protein
LGDRSLGVFLYSLKIIDNFPIVKPVSELAGPEEVVRIMWFAKSRLIDRESFVYQNATQSEGLFYAGDKGPVEVSEDQDSTIGVFRQRIDAFLLEIHLPGLYGKSKLLGHFFPSAKGLGGFVASDCGQVSLSQIDCVVAVTRCEIQDWAWKILLCQKVNILLE